MKDGKKTKEHLLNELVELRQRIAELEKSEKQRNQAEEVLRENKERYKALFDRSIYCVYVHDFEGRFIDANDAALNLLGYKKEDIPSVNFSTLFDEDQLPIAFKNMEELLQTGSQKRPIEHKLRKKDGGCVWVEAEGSVIYKQGKPYAIQGIARDITERKRAEGALRESEEKFRILAETNAAAIVIFQGEKFCYVNPATEALTGYSKEELLKKNFVDFIHPEFRELVKEIESARLRGEKINPVNEFKIITKSGKTRWVTTTAGIVEFEGKPAALGTAFDITEHKQAEEALQDRIEFEKLITILSTNFINIEPKDLDKWINFALASVGEFVGVDRSYVFLFSRDEKKMDNTHEWCEKGIEPQIQRLKGVSIDTFPWFANRIMNGETICISRVADLPPEASAEKEEFHLSKIQSLINIPMIYRKSIIGFIGFDSVRKEKTWAEDNIMLLKILGEIFLNALVRKQADEALRESEERYRILFEESKEAIYITSQEGKFVDVNQSALDLFGYIREEMIGLNALQIYVNPDERTRFQQDIEQTGFVRNYKVKFRKKDGTEMDCLLTSTLWNDINGTILGYQGIIRDITELKKVEDQLRYISLHDPLTSLYNRAYFEEEMHRVESGRYDSAGIIMCDVDGLKLVNDALGHYTGDNLLKETANILKESFREGDVAARVGGDEFAVLLPNSDRNAIEIAKLRIQDAVERYNSSNPPLPLSISIGSAIGTGSSIIMTNLFKEADNNMYREKLQNTLNARSTIVQTLMKALETRDFTAKGHVSRLRKLSTDLAMSIGLQEQRITDLRLLAEFHDIGKVGISDHILFKTGPLTSEEIIEMQRHCEIGHRIALCTPDLIPIANLILKHHEWWNGKGYPLGIKGEEIPLECRVLAIAETYEAMTSDRPYHKAISHEEAVAELRRISGTKFAPDLVTKFIEVLDNIKE